MPGPAAAVGRDVAQRNPVKMLFGKGYALQTVLMWVIFFCSLLNLFLFAYWLPEVLHLTGVTPPEAARASSFRELGAVMAVLYLGMLIDRFGPERGLTWHYAASIAFIAVIALVAMPYLLLVVVIFFAGMTIVGSQTGANAACGKLYPARMRTSGLGWALGIGRLGGIAAWRVSAVARPGTDAHLPKRLPVCAGGLGGDSPARAALRARLAPGRPALTSFPEPGLIPIVCLTAVVPAPPRLRAQPRKPTPVP